MSQLDKSNSARRCSHLAMIALAGIGLLQVSDSAPGWAAGTALSSNWSIAANTSQSHFMKIPERHSIFQYISENSMSPEEFWTKMLGALEQENGSVSYKKFKETFGDSLVSVAESNGWNIYGFYLGGYSGQIFEEPRIFNGTPYINTTLFMSILVKINLENKYCVTAAAAVNELYKRGWKMKDKAISLSGFKGPVDTFDYNNGSLLFLSHYDHPPPSDDGDACVTEVQMRSGRPS